jgi:hypothetical protein
MEWDDGHLSRTLIAQGLKRPHPSRLRPDLLYRNKFEWAFLTPFQRSGIYLILLRMGFTQLPQSLRILVSSYLTFSPLSRKKAVTPLSRDGIFSVALSLSRVTGTVRITDHPALWSSDFPPLMIYAQA